MLLPVVLFKIGKFPVNHDVDSYCRTGEDESLRRKHQHRGRYFASRRYYEPC